MSFLRLYFDDYNCNKSCLGTCFSRLIPLITQQQYMSGPETEPGTPSPWLILYQSYLGTYALGKGLMELLQPWGILFIYSQQLAEKYIRPPLQLVRWVLSRPLLMSKSEASVISTLNKIYTKLWVTETVFDSGVKFSPLETMNPVALFTTSYW